MSSQLPIHLTRFIGREQEIGDIRRLLVHTRLLTLSGPGGSGKTRLAIEVAREVAERYEDGLVWVDLATIAEASLVAQAVAKAAGVTEQPGRSFREALAAFLRDAHLLLVLDNCEHLVTACARLAGSLLSACPGLQLLTTSREPLALAGETIYPVPALSFPTDGPLARPGSLEMLSADLLEELQGYEAISLFLDRATALMPDYALTAENVRAVTSICRQLDGMPLAIELAAARVNVLTAEQIAGRLDDQFALLISHHRGGIAARHQTLRAAIDWSYDLLTTSEQLLLQRLSVFAGRCTLATVEAVCTGEGVEPDQLLNLLSSLVNKSLVVAETLRPRDARYSLLETIRQYAAEKLQAAGEQPTLRDKHLQCYLQLVEETEPKLNGEYQQWWLDWLEDELDNIRAALSWSLESDQIESGLRIAAALYQFWTIRDYRAEGLSWYERLLAQPKEGISPAVRGNALAYASLMASFAGQTETQIRYAEEAVRVGEVAGEAGKQALANALGAQAYAARRTGDFHTAMTLGLRQIEVHRELGDRYMVGLGLCYYSFMAMSLEQYDKAHAMLDEGLPLLREAGNPYRIAMALNYRGDLARCEENHAEAVAAYEESITLLRDLGGKGGIAHALNDLGKVALVQEHYAQAIRLYHESLAVLRE
ncbi:MAG: tetratricopeptide repeat protein, partial [Chloroflexota bacterium]|nr:tetratricopeptide repeat protein [Chloroflexota bacterium]